MAGCQNSPLHAVRGKFPGWLQVGSYTGGGDGLSTGGDAVHLYNADGRLQASVTFGASPAEAPFATFENASGAPAVTISQLSACLTTTRSRSAPDRSSNSSGGGGN